MAMLISLKERFFLKRKKFGNHLALILLDLISLRLDMSFVEKK
jgi:hypothetical protein